MHIDRNSRWTVALVLLLCSAAIFALLRWVCVWWVCIPFSLGLVWLAVWQTMFHMVPDRIPAAGPDEVSAVADGIIVHIGRDFEEEHLGRYCTMISIYMDFWDVHANFWPVTGKVSHTEYHPGKHMLAFKPKASLENEHSCTSIVTHSGKEVFFKQLAGGFARRIVCYAREGMEVSAGLQCGIIKFGSRIDIYIPEDAQVLCREGDRVVASETVIARL